MSKSDDEILLKLLKAKKVNIEEITNFIKKHNIDINKLDNHGYNFLHYAIKTENPNIVNLLLNTHNNENKINTDNNDELSEDLNQQQKADVNIKTNDNTNNVYLSPLFLTLNYVNDVEDCYKIAKLLLKANADILEKDENNCNVAQKAAELGRIDLINLFKSKADDILNTTNNIGSLLHFAILGDKEDTISYLIENKINLKVKDQNGNNALSFAIIKRMFNAFKQLADNIIQSNITNEEKKDIFNSVNEEGNTILHELAYAKSSILIDFINKFDKSYSIDKEIKNKDGYTYKEVQENIVKLEKDRIDKQKQEQELLRKEKQKILKEAEIERQAELERIEKIRLSEERSNQTKQTLTKHRGTIFCLAVTFSFLILLFFINKSANKKKQEIII